MIVSPARPPSRQHCALLKGSNALALQLRLNLYKPVAVSMKTLTLDQEHIWDHDIILLVGLIKDAFCLIVKFYAVTTVLHVLRLRWTLVDGEVT